MSKKKQDNLITFVSFAAMQNGSTMIPPEVNVEILNKRIGGEAYIFFLQLLAFKDETNILHLNLLDWISATRSSKNKVFRCLHILEGSKWIKANQSKYKGFIRVKIKFGQDAYQA